MEISLPQFVFPDSSFPQMKNTWYSIASQFTSSLIISSQDALLSIDDSNSSIFLLRSIFPIRAFTSIRNALSKDCIFVGVIRIAI